MKGAFEPWGDDLIAALVDVEGQSAPMAALLICPDGVHHLESGPAAQRVSLVRGAVEKWGNLCTFHLYGEGFDYRWDRGSGCRLNTGPTGALETRPVQALLVDSRRASGALALAAAAPTGIARMREFVNGDHVVELMLEELC